MAVKYSTVDNEPIQDILDRIRNGHIAALTTDVYGDNESDISIVEYFGCKWIASLDNTGKSDGFTVSKEGGKTAFILSCPPFKARISTLGHG